MRLLTDFRISGQSLINENCPNSRTSNDIDVKLETITKLDKGNTAKNIDADVILVNCDVIATFSIYGQFGAIRKLDSGCMVCKSYIFININLLFYKT